MSKGAEELALKAALAAEEKAKERRLAHLRGDLTPLEQLARDFVIGEIKGKRCRTDLPIVMIRAYGPVLDRYHEQYETKWGDGPNGSMVEVHHHMLPEELLTNKAGDPLPLRVVTVTFTPGTKDAPSVPKRALPRRNRKR